MKKNLPPRAVIEQRYKNARNNLMLMIVLSMVNLILAALGSGVMMLFSATVPYLAVLIGIVSEIGIVLVVCIGIAAVILGTYLLCWAMSKRHYGWMIAALVMFVLDTVVMLVFYLSAWDASAIMDILIHGWVVYYLAVGVRNGYLRRKLPEESWAEVEAETETGGDSVPLRPADMSVKARVLLEADAVGRRICYRRVKRVNELIVDGYVYDQVEMLIETAHTLRARLDGHEIQMSCDNSGMCSLVADGEIVAQKMRII